MAVGCSLIKPKNRESGKAAVSAAEASRTITSATGTISVTGNNCPSP